VAKRASFLAQAMATPPKKKTTKNGDGYMVDCTHKNGDFGDGLLLGLTTVLIIVLILE